LRYMGLLVMAVSISSPATAQRPVEARDLLRIREVSDPQLSPDGAWVAYTVSTSDTVEDKRDADVWMTRWDGERSVRLTYSKARERSPRWSPDGRYLAFLSSRDDPREVEQVWLLDRTGGEAERVTDLPGGVSDYA
jgi:dipeptidyl aminopeptidase/acylaminoacyl peptidase